MTAIPTVIISRNYANELFAFCNVTGASLSECGRYSANQTNNYTDWLYQMSYDNINFYHNLSAKVIGQVNITEANRFDDLLVNYNFINFLAMMALFAINFIIIMIMNTIIKEADYGNITPSDFTLMVSNIEKEKYDNTEHMIENVLEIV
jgi:hypothetical protein